MYTRPKHFISFEEAVAVFENNKVTWEDKRHNYGETRFVSIGPVKLSSAKVIITVVHTLRQHKIRIISARKANKKERALYHEFIN